VTDIGNAIVDGNLAAATAIEPGDFANAFANRHDLPFDPPHDFEFFRSSSLKTSRQAVTPSGTIQKPGHQGDHQKYFLGTGDYVLEERQRCVDIIGEFLDDLGLAAEIRTASDPFYIAPDASSKTYFQLTAETKYELSAVLPNEQRLAIGSLNYHTDFFGRAFDINVEGAGPAHSSCIGFGLERFVCAFLAQHGNDPSDWPEEVRTAIAGEILEAQ